MDEAQFDWATQELARQFHRCKNAAKLLGCDWQDVTLIRTQNLPSGSGHFFRITRQVPVDAADERIPSASPPQGVPIIPSTAVESEAAEDADRECLPKFSTIQAGADPVPLGATVTITYDIIYSSSYCVPVLYIHRPPPPTAPGVFLSSIKDAAISVVDHPVTGTPVYFIHPCRTPEAMREILGDSRAMGGMAWLMVWFGCIGASAGLSIPIALAMEME